MANRHQRTTYFIEKTKEIRGESDHARIATPEELKKSKDLFRFSEIVKRTADDSSDALLKALATTMIQETDPSSDSNIPSGFTYLGQFLDHDLTLDKTKLPLGTPMTATQMIQGRSPTLDLDSLYGAGPSDSENTQFYHEDKVQLRIGRTAKIIGLVPPTGAPVYKDYEGFDLPRIGAANPEKERYAQIPDIRNDENLAVAQTHLAFIRFHNAVVTRVAGKGTPSAKLFEKAREQVVKHYQWMIREDFLPRIVDPRIVKDVFTNGRKVFEVGAPGFPTMPIEFSVAAYRIGHSMVRDKYDWNTVFTDNIPRESLFDLKASLTRLFQFSGTSGFFNAFDPDNLDGPSGLTHYTSLPSNWIADWTRMYDFVADGIPELKSQHDVPNFARPIDIRLTDPLRQLPLGAIGESGSTTVPPFGRNLAYRNLVRGSMVKLATGQEVFDHINPLVPGITPLTPEEIIGVEFTTLPDTLKDELTTATPLWFYVLREASLNGGKLGAVGGRIVAETFHRAMEGSSISILKDTKFSPTLGRNNGSFKMTDLLMVAYDASEGELRPLSPHAPRPYSV
jgi:Animal haem peroxidase